MDEKSTEKFNLSLSVPVMERFKKLSARYGKRKKGEVFTAAMILLLQADEKTQDKYIGEVAKANITGDFSNLLGPLKVVRIGKSSVRALEANPTRHD